MPVKISSKVRNLFLFDGEWQIIFPKNFDIRIVFKIILLLCQLCISAKKRGLPNLGKPLYQY